MMHTPHSPRPSVACPAAHYLITFGDMTCMGLGQL